MLYRDIFVILYSMGEPFKNLVNEKLIDRLVSNIKEEYSAFDARGFTTFVLDDTFVNLELKQRVNRVAEGLYKFLPQDYKEAIGIIDKVVSKYGLETDDWQAEFCWFYPSFIEYYGTHDWETSIPALARYTKHSSSEFAVRPFIVKDQERMMAQMQEWSKSDCEHIRRLSSEGCRPLLPWGMGIPSLKKDPSPIIPILEQLKDDPSEYVRRSVANNLNDISKNQPELVIELAKKWHGKSKNTDRLIKHALRTLLKKNNSEALKMFGFGEKIPVMVSNFSLTKNSTTIGEDTEFSFTVEVKEATKVRLEYGIDYQMKSGKPSRKIFQISELPLKENEKRNYTRKHSFKDVSIRKHYPGKHAVTLIVNGTECGTLEFEVKEGVKEE